MVLIFFLQNLIPFRIYINHQNKNLVNFSVCTVCTMRTFNIVAKKNEPQKIVLSCITFIDKNEM
jgi:hypothetical protein